MSTNRVPKVGEVWTTCHLGVKAECVYVTDAGALWRWPDGGHAYEVRSWTQEYWTPPTKPPMPEPIHTELWVTPDGLLVISPSRDRVAKFRIVHTADGQGYEIVDFEDLR